MCALVLSCKVLSALLAVSATTLFNGHYMVIPFVALPVRVDGYWPYDSHSSPQSIHALCVTPHESLQLLLLWHYPCRLTETGGLTAG